MIMHKVMIVEDDRIIRRGLCQAIPWEQNGFYVAGEAGDGEVAIELIEKEQPQVVVSDINMPFMNGLEMAKLVKEKSPATKIIFLTGYEDFSYAQQAIKVRAYDYLLKPVDSEQLLQKVIEAATEWENDRVNEKRILDSMPLLQQNFLQNLTRQEAKRVDIEAELLALDIHLDGPFFSSLLIHFDSSNKEDNERFKDNATKRISDFLTSCEGAVLNAGENEIAVFLSLETNQSNKIEILAKDLLQLQDEGKQQLTITYGRVYDNVFELGHSYIDCRLAMDMRHIMGPGKIYRLDDISSNCKQSEENVKELDRKLENQIKLGLPEKVSETLAQLNVAIFESRKSTLLEMKTLAVKYSSMLFYEIEKWRKEEVKGFNSSKYYEDIMKLTSLNEMFEILQRLVQEWSSLMNKSKQNSRYTLVDQAIEYMKDTFHETGLTLQKVANHIHVSSPYLSNLFKVEKGFNFGDCLLELRMKKAMEILGDVNLKTYEVSEQVGYSNPQYFSICFKKYTGYTPAEYRKKH
ncbi:response regulator [Mesobacillus maritimus]|uniref:response regulator n=1 Tax=Mesobacillus maritimus TaxID=1643336 RepID=UPI00384AD3CC